MRKLILVSATTLEIKPTLDFLSSFVQQDGLFILPNIQIHVCITGVGMVNTAFELGKLVQHHFDLALNVGLAGSFDGQNKGSLVNVTSDCFCELGAENDATFLSMDELGFGEAEIKPNKTIQHAVMDSLPKGRGVSVNTVHGNENSIQQLLKRYPAQTESMEGAAFFLAANNFSWNCAQIRAISNKVEKRNRENWDITLAVINLNEFLISLIQRLP